jgi:hypothetical protein
MRNILNSVKLDYYILKSSDFRRIAIVAVVAVLAGAMSKNPLLIMGIIMMISGFFMSTIFAVVEKNNLNKLYGILPVKRWQTVIGRYLFAFLAGVVMAILASILALIASSVLADEFSTMTFIYWLCGSFLVYCTLISLQFPLYFKYEISKVAAFANLPFIVVVIFGSFLTKKHPELFGQTVSLFTHNHYLVWLVGIGASLVVIGISTLISIGLYQHREL